MATRQEERMVEPDMNPKDLWLEEIFTDRRVGTIRRMTPVDGAGARDAGREVLYIGETQVMSQLGALPINFVLEAKSLELGEGTSELHTALIAEYALGLRGRS